MVRDGAKDERKANRRGAARLAAVQALYQMDIAGTGLNDILAEFESHWIGREVEVLVEGRDELGRPYGRIRQGKRAVVLGHAELGTLVDIRVIQATAGQLTGTRAA